MNSLIEYHEISNLFPLIEGKEFHDLVENIKNHGVKEPIWLYEGKILDGRNRYRAAQEAGVSFQTKEFTGTSLEALEHVWALNRTRRHLTSGQAAISDAKRDQLQKVYERMKEEARGRQREGGGDKKSEEYRKSVQELIPEPIRDKKTAPQTRDIRAKVSGTNPKYIDFADRLVREHPDLAEEVHLGKMTLTQAQRELKKKELFSKIPDKPSGKYRVIYADPPWSYNDKCDEGAIQSGGCEKHYPSMTIKELCELPVKEMAEEDAVLFLWTTSPLLQEAFPVIKEWGFQYKASFIWDKVKHNMGHYNSVRHEFLLICTRGSCTPDVKKLFDSVQSIERTDKHSQKPPEFREIIDALYPHGTRIELFARESAPGWSVWGNEVQAA